VGAHLQFPPSPPGQFSGSAILPTLACGGRYPCARVRSFLGDTVSIRRSFHSFSDSFLLHESSQDGHFLLCSVSSAHHYPRPALESPCSIAHASVPIFYIPSSFFFCTLLCTPTYFFRLFRSRSPFACGALLLPPGLARFFFC